MATESALKAIWQFKVVRLNSDVPCQSKLPTGPDGSAPVL